MSRDRTFEALEFADYSIDELQQLDVRRGRVMREEAKRRAPQLVLGVFGHRRQIRLRLGNVLRARQARLVAAAPAATPAARLARLGPLGRLDALLLRRVRYHAAQQLRRRGEISEMTSNR